MILASASPRRLDLLRMFGLEPRVLPADVDETPTVGEKPAELVERLAKDKAEAVLATLGDEKSAHESLIVAADTVIDLDGTVFGKPIDDDDAREMLIALSGRSHGVVTGMAVVGLRGGEYATEVAVGRTEVWIRTLTAEDIGWYIATGEPRGKAGAYAIQGLGSVLVDRVEGSYQNVVGLSLPMLDSLTRSFGHPLRTLVPA